MKPGCWIEADAYLFDIDGTLLHASGRAHYNAFTSAFQAIFGVHATIDGVRWAGNTDIGIIREVLVREGFSPDMLTAQLSRVIEHMSAEVENNREHMRAIPCASVDILIRHLHDRGKLLGIASGNFSRIGWIKLEAAGLRDYFSFGVFSDHSPTRTEIFRAGVNGVRERLGADASICVVGDTPSDIEAARVNGLPVIAVATGGYSLQDLKAHAPDLCLRCCDDVFA